MPSFKKWKKRNFKTKKSAWAVKGRVDRLGCGDAPLVKIPPSQQHAARQVLRTTDGINLTNPLGVPYVAWSVSGSQLVGMSTYMTSAGNWTSLSGIYDEFRPLGIRFKYVPQQRYGQSVATPSNIPILVAWDNDGDFPPAPTTAQVAQYGTSKLFNSSEPWEVYYKYAPPAKDQWFNLTNANAWPPQMGIAPAIVGSPTLVTGGLGVLLIEVDVIMRGVR